MALAMQRELESFYRSTSKTIRHKMNLNKCGLTSDMAALTTPMLPFKNPDSALERIMVVNVRLKPRHIIDNATPSKPIMIIGPVECCQSLPTKSGLERYVLRRTDHSIFPIALLLTPLKRKTVIP